MTADTTAGGGTDFERICALKHAYFRLLDLKRFAELGELLTDDATSAYQSGELSHQGRAAIVAFLEQSLGNPSIVSMHNGHHPEITVNPDGTADGTWYLEDRVVVAGADFDLRGTAIYRDRYRKEHGSWRISHTGYDRIFEERRKLHSGELVSFTSRFDDDGAPQA